MDPFSYTITAGSPRYFFTLHENVVIHAAETKRGVEIYPEDGEQYPPALIFLEKREVEVKGGITTVTMSCQCRVVLSPATSLNAIVGRGTMMKVEKGPECEPLLGANRQRRLPQDGLFKDRIIIIFHGDRAGDFRKAEQKATVFQWGSHGWLGEWAVDPETVR